MRRKFFTLDVFTEKRFAGNPLAVVLEPDGLDTAAMQALARDGLHRGSVEPVRLQHDGERIAGKAFPGEHVECHELAAHPVLTVFPRRTRGLD